MKKKSLLLGALFLALAMSFQLVVAGFDWTTTHSFRIYQSGSLTWGAGTHVCNGTLTNGPTETVTCSPGSISASTQYRVEFILLEGGAGKTMTQGENVTQFNVYGNNSVWAGTEPTFGNCGFNDFESDDTSDGCILSTSLGRVILKPNPSTTIELGAVETEGFMYIITTDSDVPSSSSDSYLQPNIDSDTTQSSTITINGPGAVPEFSDYAILLILITVVGGFFAMKRKVE